MRTLLRNLMIALLAVQMPLCCCEVRAAMASLAHASHAEDPQEGSGGCCVKLVKSDCCARSGDGAGSDRGESDGAPSGDACCVGCKDRAAPTLASGIELDTVHSLNFVASATLAIQACLDATDARHAAPLHRDTGPPCAPGGRVTLALHSTLVI